jgi:sugar phosphate isomerase/epimerase
MNPDCGYPRFVALPIMVQMHKSQWGMSTPPLKSLGTVADAGYDGFECAVVEIQDPGEFRRALSDSGLSYLPLIFTEGLTPAEHLADFEQLVERASEFRPNKIIAHAGRDHWSLDEQLRFLEATLVIERKLGIPIAHETHRRRPLYSPMNSEEILTRLPELRVNTDLSHWCCVTESMLEDHTDTIELVTARSIHIHARVGYENGPQVSDPRAPEWSDHLATFERWWKEMIRAHSDQIITVTPEYGPPTYMHTLPNSNEPVADLWDVCSWAATRFRRLLDND